MKSIRNYSRAGLVLSIVAGSALAVLLCTQCVRNYLYVDRTLVPEEARREAERQSVALTIAARSAQITDPHGLSAVFEHAIDEAADRVIWMRLANRQGDVVAQAGTPLGDMKVPPRWWQGGNRESPERVIRTTRGKAIVTLVGFRMPRPAGVGSGRAGEQRPAALALEVALDFDAVAGVFSRLRENLVSGVAGAFALIAALAVIGFRAPRYLRGKYLEKEMAFARRVQSDLLPKTASVSPNVEFSAAAIAADEVGGDFLDIFQNDSGSVSIVLGDVSGKGISAALLASVVQGAIRSCSGAHLEAACDRINRMLCEKTASERFVTLFWGAFDPLTATLRYVNAGHAAPLLQRANPGPGNAADRFDKGGPVLGVLPNARYTCGAVQLSSGDTLVVFSDGVNEAADPNDQEFGGERIRQVVAETQAEPPDEMCQRIMTRVAGFAAPGPPQDDRTLMVVRFLKSRAAMTA